MKKKHECPVCGVMADTATGLAQHLMLHMDRHHPNYFRCPCGRLFHYDHYFAFNSHLEDNGGAWFHWMQSMVGVTNDESI